MSWEAQQNHESTGEYSGRQRKRDKMSSPERPARRPAEIRALKRAVKASAAQVREMDLAIEALRAKREAAATEHARQVAELAGG